MEGMITFFEGFVLAGSIWLFWGLVLALIISLFSFDNNENGIGAFFSFAIFSVVTYFWSSFNILEYVNWVSVGTYLGIGFIYSLIRTYFLGRKTKLKASGDRKYLKEKLKGNVFRWWLLWPVSLLNWILSDLVRDLYNLVYKKLQKLYEGIFELGLKNYPENETK